MHHFMPKADNKVYSAVGTYCRRRGTPHAHTDTHCMPDVLGQAPLFACVRRFTGVHAAHWGLPTQHQNTPTYLPMLNSSPEPKTTAATAPVENNAQRTQHASRSWRKAQEAMGRLA